YVLDAFHQLNEPVVIRRSNRSKSHPAIPHHCCCDSVPARWSQPFIPGRLAIIVGMNVYKARRHELASGVDLDQPGTRHRSQACNDALGYRDISLVCRSSCTIGDSSAADDEVVTASHGNLLAGLLALSAPKAYRSTVVRATFFPAMAATGRHFSHGTGYPSSGAWARQGLLRVVTLLHPSVRLAVQLPSARCDIVYCSGPISGRTQPIGWSRGRSKTLLL